MSLDDLALQDSKDPRRGGMGEVYLAHGAKLDRNVAVKTPPVDVASNQDRMTRVVREAKSGAALNRSNIAHIYEIGEENGRSIVTMRFVQGEAL